MYLGRKITLNDWQQGLVFVRLHVAHPANLSNDLQKVSLRFCRNGSGDYRGITLKPVLHVKCKSFMHGGSRCGA